MSSPAPLSTSATVDTVYELSRVLDCGLDRRTVQILMALIDAGVHPVALVRGGGGWSSASGGAHPRLSEEQGARVMQHEAI